MSRSTVLGGERYGADGLVLWTKEWVTCSEVHIMHEREIWEMQTGVACHR